MQDPFYHKQKRGKNSRMLDADAWLEGLNAGRSFVTTGPMLFVTLDGREPGHRFSQATPAPRDHALAGSVASASPLDRIEVVLNGEVARTMQPANRPGWCIRSPR